MIEGDATYDYYDGTNNLGGTGSSSGGGGGSEGLGQSNNSGMNQYNNSGHVSPVRGQSPTRMGRESSSPFIPRSSTNRLMTSASPMRRSNQSQTLENNPQISTEQLSEIIKEAVSNALETAQNQWIKELKNGTFTHPDYAGSENFQHRFTQLASKVDILQDQVSFFVSLFV